MTIADVRSKLVEAIALIDALDAPLLGTPVYTLNNLQLQETRTNVAFPSSMQGWSLGNATLAFNSETAPDNTQTASRLYENANNGIHEVYKTCILSTGLNCVSFYVKAGTASKGRVWLVNGGTGIYADFDLAAGTIEAPGKYGTATPLKSFIENVGNGWYRVAVSGTVGIPNAFADVSVRNDAGLSEYAGTGKYLIVCNAQCEAGGFPSSYIPTVAAAVTRQGNAVISTMPALTQVTMLLNAKTPAAWPTDYAVLLHVDGNTTSPYNDLELFQDAAGVLTLRVTYNNSIYSEISFGVLAPNTTFKLAFSANASGLRASFNGGAIQQAAIPTWPNNLTYRRFGTQLQGIRCWNGWLYKADQWNVVATDSQLQALSV